MGVVNLTKTVVDAAKPLDRDYELRDAKVPGFLCKVTPKGRKVYLVAYRTGARQRRKFWIGHHGEITVDQARKAAQEVLSQVRRGLDPQADREASRAALTVSELCERYMREHAIPRKKPSSQQSDRYLLEKRVKPALGNLKVDAVSRADVSRLISSLSAYPVAANRTLAVMRKMFNLAEVWGLRPDGSNPTRMVQKFKETGGTRYITDEELAAIYRTLEKIEAERSEEPSITRAVRLQFELAARRSEVINLRWDWITKDAKGNPIIRWPDSKTGAMEKPLSTAVQAILEAADSTDSPYVCPALKDREKPLAKETYNDGWGRILKAAGVKHVGTHGIRHRAATDIANSGGSIKDGMALTGHKTVTMFMRYVHVQADPLKALTERASERRRAIAAGQSAEVVPFQRAS